MKKLSLLFQLSGGCGPKENCKDCCNFIPAEDGKYHSHQCACYPGNDEIPYSFWHEDWPACKWFNNADQAEPDAVMKRRRNLNRKSRAKKAATDKAENKIPVDAGKTKAKPQNGMLKKTRAEATSKASKPKAGNEKPIKKQPSAVMGKTKSSNSASAKKTAGETKATVQAKKPSAKPSVPASKTTKNKPAPAQKKNTWKFISE